MIDTTIVAFHPHIYFSYCNKSDFIENIVYLHFSRSQLMATSDNGIASIIYSSYLQLACVKHSLLNSKCAYCTICTQYDMSLFLKDDNIHTYNHTSTINQENSPTVHISALSPQWSYDTKYEGLLFLSPYVLKMTFNHCSHIHYINKIQNRTFKSWIHGKQHFEV